MASDTSKLVILMTKGIDHEVSSVGFTIANGAITAGMEVLVFLTSAAIDVVRKKGQAMTHVPPLDPLATMIDSFLARGGRICACPPCVTARGYQQSDLLDGVVIQGASVMFAEFKAGAASLSF